MFGHGKDWDNAKIHEENKDLWAKYGNLKRAVDKLEQRVHELETLVEVEEDEEIDGDTERTD